MPKNRLIQGTGSERLLAHTWQKSSSQYWEATSNLSTVSKTNVCWDSDIETAISRQRYHDSNILLHSLDPLIKYKYTLKELARFPKNLRKQPLLNVDCWQFASLSRWCKLKMGKIIWVVLVLVWKTQKRKMCLIDINLACGFHVAIRLLRNKS